MKKSRLILIILSVLLLISCISMTGFLLFSNYRNIRIFKQAQNNFLRGDDSSLALAEAQLLRLVRSDDDNEEAYIMLGKIAGKQKVYPEQVYYCFMAHRLNPLSSENKARYVESLSMCRYFDRLEIFLAQQPQLSAAEEQILLYAAGHNGDLSKYKFQLARQGKAGHIGKLALLLFENKHLSNKEKLSILRTNFSDSKEAFLRQEAAAAEVELCLAIKDIDNAEKALLHAYKLNEFAFAPVLGRFFAQYRSFGKALEIFEKHLAAYHDPVTAVQTAEIYCLLNRTDAIAALRNQYQADTGNTAMLFSFYFDALIALAKNDIAALKELTVPLKKGIKTPLAAFMYLCVAVQDDSVAEVKKCYQELLAHDTYLDLSRRADRMVGDFLKRSLKNPGAKLDDLADLAGIFYKQSSDVFAAKLILLAQKNRKQLNLVLLEDSLKRFGSDPGIIKIALEYYLNNDLARAEKLISSYRKQFPARHGDMLRYELVLAVRQKNPERISELFRSSFTPENLPDYWAFASSTMREKDLIFLSRNKLYEPFCKALLLLKQGKKAAACDLLERADTANNYTLLFFAAKTLAENGRNLAALKKYALFPPDSPYRTTVWMNMAELYMEKGDLDQALNLARRAYNAAPEMAETQLCYADKLHRKGDLSAIPDVIKLSSARSFRRELKPLWIAGMVQRIKACNADTQRETLRELCRRLLAVAPDNNTALEYMNKLQKMP